MKPINFLRLMNINHQLIQKTIQLILTPQHSDNETTKQVVGHLKSIPGIKVFGRNAMEEFLKTHNIAGLQQMVDNKAHPTFRVMRQSCSAYSLSLKYLSSLKPYALRFITFILLFIPSTLAVEI